MKKKKSSSLSNNPVQTKRMIFWFTAPVALVLILIFAYPVIRTVFMSFFDVKSVTASTSKWVFNGVDNYIHIFQSPSFRAAVWNMIKIWLVGGVVTLSISLMFAAILTSGIRGKKFFRAVIYLPNVISATALATMWIQYVFNFDFGLLNSIIRFFGGDGVKWLNMDYKFWAMLAAFIFGSVGYYMLIFISGIDNIPKDIYEAATIDGASKTSQLFKITIPLLRGNIKTNMLFWSIGATGFFLWTMMFSPVNQETATIVPMVYLYNSVFGSAGTAEINAGLGAATGVVLCLVVLLFYAVMNRSVKDEDMEY